ncbi:lysophospholipid acyltransferase family protein [Albimonas sp. CAU 1670]|uniref:lysophospholipid acyltransferase family protein n=1 Tax=Albimonas sp. CAU 1670 TaxID=3032599 RepID=UPI0023DB8DE0|nr:lysophospholipid acyltransferase family protein [Albimonas sp. CAU 1670]MDF2232106.1 lysophospholipid acyltransferase family protein [Albimonas sp. CAU 1670]
MSDAVSDFSWAGPPPPPLPRATAWGTIAAYVRLGLAILTTVVLLSIYLVFKGIERVIPAFRARERVQRLWARTMGRLVGLSVTVTGEPMPHGGALVANHSSWSDIFVLVGAARMTFVSKAEVRAWPVVGWIAAVCGTVFVERKRSAAKAQEAEMRARMIAGERLLFFPEGTSTDNRRVLHFRSTLFAALTAPELRDVAWVQPVSVVYRTNPATTLPDTFYGWWGDMEFGPHVWSLLTRSFGGEAEVVFHDPIRVADMPDRKKLAQESWRAVHDGVVSRLPHHRHGHEDAYGDRED